MCSTRYYSATILQMAGVRDDRLAIWLAGLTTLTNFLFTLLGVWLVERVGRRKLTLGSIIGKSLKMSTSGSDVYSSFLKYFFHVICVMSSTGTCLSLSLLAIGFLIAAEHSPPVTFHPTDPSMVNFTCSKYQWVRLEFRWFQATVDPLLLEEHLLCYVTMTLYYLPLLPTISKNTGHFYSTVIPLMLWSK